MLSFRSRDEIEALEKAVAERPQAREAQRALAEELTALVHGEAERDAVVAASQALFGRGELAALDAGTLAAALAELPSAEVDVAADGWPPVVDLFAATGLAPSKSAARRAVAEGGAYLNNARVDRRGRTASAAATCSHGRVAGAAPRQAEPGRGPGPRGARRLTSRPRPARR